MIQQCLPFVLKVGQIHTFSVELKDAIGLEEAEARRVARIMEKRPLAAWSTCFRTNDGTLYLAGDNWSTDGGCTVVPHGNVQLGEISMLDRVHDDGAPEGVSYSRPGLFFALGGRVYRDGPNAYHVKTWRSTDDLKTLQEGRAMIRLPNDPGVPKKPGRRYCDDVAIVRDIIAMPNGTLVTTGYAPVDDETAIPFTTSGKNETAHLLKTFVLRSTDDGLSWNYFSTVAATRAGDPVIEGFNEPTLALLDDGDLLCIMRTGHHTPLYSSRSSDGGRTWSEPVYTGLERGCFPCLRKLADGRLVLSFGNRFPPGWSRIGAEDDHGRFQWPGEGTVKLAISQDGRGDSWEQTTIASGLGSCYTTMFEVEPNILFMQVDGWYWRVLLAPRIPDAL